MKNIDEILKEGKNTRLLLTAFQAILDDTPSMVFVKDINHVYQAASVPFTKMVGKNVREEIIGHSDYDIFEDKNLARRYVADDMKLLATGEDRLDYIEPLPEENGQPRYGSTSKYVLKDADGNPIGIAGVSRDITREYLANQNHQAEIEYLFDLPDDTYYAAFIDINTWRIITERRQSIDGYSFDAHENIDAFIQAAYSNIVDRKDPAYAFYRYFSKDSLRGIYANGKRDFSMEYVRRFSDGSHRWVHDEIRFMVDPSNSHMCAMLIVRDIHSQKENQRNLVWAAERDDMTGLFNRAAVLKYAKAFLDKSSVGDMHALFMIDADNFKRVNDTYGHQAGDVFITRFATAIRECFRESDLVGRVGGDEFMVLMKNISDTSIVRDKSDAVVKSLKNVCKELNALDVSGSIGISIYGVDGTTVDELFEKADRAMYRAKNNGKHRAYFASEE